MKVNGETVASIHGPIGGTGNLGTGLNGGSRTSKEMRSWHPSFGSPDQIINMSKDLVDARGRDVILNDGAGSSAIHIHRNSIVGARYILNSRPDWETLGATSGWAKEFQKVAEARFSLFAESDAKWIDAGRTLTFTNLVRLAVGGFLMTGEALGTTEWIREGDRPLSTAYQSVAPARLSNPDGQSDTDVLRRGVEKDLRGKPLAYYIRNAHPGEWMDMRAYTWRRVPATTPWGKRQVLHVTDPIEPGQTRGISDMVAILSNLKMTKQFQDITLQNAVVNATYAAAIESELPSDVIATAMGAMPAQPGQGWTSAIGAYMDALGDYTDASTNLKMDGVIIPHLFPGTKLNLKPAGTPGGVGTDFESSLIRHTAAGLGVSYEEFSKDYSKISYSGGRLAAAAVDRFMAVRKQVVADAVANFIYALFIEEELVRGELPSLPGKSKRATLATFYEPLMKEAFTLANWIGASSGQVDPLKETQAAGMRIAMGLSTQSDEAALLGRDWQEVNEQRAREIADEEEKGLTYSYDATRQLTDPTSPDAPPGSGGSNG